MSCEFIKSITIKDDEVFTRQESNNVQPKIFKKERNVYLTKVNKEQGIIGLMNLLVMEALNGSVKFKPENKLSRDINAIIEEIEERKDFQKLKDEQDDEQDNLRKQGVNSVPVSRRIKEIQEEIRDMVHEDIYISIFF